MSREHKYRVWETKAKYMSTVAGLDWTMAGLKWYGPGVGSGWCYLDPDFDWEQENCNPKPEYVDILMQYTGLKDKNGVEIYEEDIVKVRNNKCQLQVLEVVGRVTERYAAWGVTDLKIIKFEKYSPKTKPHSATDIMYFLNIFDCKRIEVIGNIHQNPKRLKQ